MKVKLLLSAGTGSGVTVIFAMVGMFTVQIFVFKLDVSSVSSSCDSLALKLDVKLAEDVALMKI